MKNNFSNYVIILTLIEMDVKRKHQEKKELKLLLLFFGNPSQNHRFYLSAELCDYKS